MQNSIIHIFAVAGYGSSVPKVDIDRPRLFIRRASKNLYLLDRVPGMKKRAIEMLNKLSETINTADAATPAPAATEAAPATAPEAAPAAAPAASPLPTSGNVVQPADV
jgi:hypothetical protein